MTALLEYHDQQCLRSKTAECKKNPEIIDKYYRIVRYIQPAVLK